MSYVADPANADLPLNVHELEQLIEAGGKPLLKNSRGLNHFLRRVLVTMRGYREQMQRLHREIQQAALASEHAGAPTSLHPIDSFRYLSDEEKKRVMDAHLEEKYDVLIGELRAVQASRVEVDRIAGALKFQLAGILDEPAVPDRIKQQVSALLDQAAQLPPSEPVPDAGPGRAAAAPAPAAPAPAAPATPPSPPAATGPATPPAPKSDGLDDLFNDWLSA